MRSYPTFASQRLNGSAFLEGMDWINLKIVSVLALSVSLNLPSSAGIFNCTILSYGSNPSSRSLAFKSDQYLFGIELSVKTATISIIEKYHPSLYHNLRMFIPSKTTKAFSGFISSSHQ